MSRTSLVSNVARLAGDAHDEPNTEGARGGLHKLFLSACTVAVMLTGGTGCMTVHNGFEALRNNGAWNETVLVLRNRSFSAKAWHRRKHHFCKQKYLKDFCAGFRAGYEDVAAGGGECTPAFPPQSYWGWEFQSAEGQGRTAAWFAGYPHGARAAEEEGVGSWSQIAISTGVQAEYQQHGTFQHEGAVYPIPDQAPAAAMPPGVVERPQGPVEVQQGPPMRVEMQDMSPGEVIQGPYEIQDLTPPR